MFSTYICVSNRQIAKGTDGLLTLFLDDGTRLSGLDVVMFATGRKPNTHRPDLNLVRLRVTPTLLNTSAVRKIGSIGSINEMLVLDITVYVR